MKKSLHLSIILFALLVWLIPLDAVAVNNSGDVNNDGEINIADVNAIIDIIMGSESNYQADVNCDGEVNIADVNTIIGIILGDTTVATETFTVNGVTFSMVKVSGGTYIMGAGDDDSEASNSEKPAHQVTLSSYSIGETEVTQALWQAVMGSNPSFFTPNYNYELNLQRPVESVSWNDCQLFIAKLNELTGKQFRLPTEAEWEFAARGGKKSQGYKFAGSETLSDVAWYWDNLPSQITTAPNYGTQTVATRSPNELGLYDMNGNVLEWCQDRYDRYRSNAQTDPVGPSSGFNRVFRGGSWNFDEQNCRVSFRVFSYQSRTRDDLGFRLALDVDSNNKLHLSETVISVEINESKSVDIYNGNGNYVIEGGEDNVSCTVNGDSLTVTGAIEGATTVHVTDTSTGATTILTVFVTPNEMFTVNGVTFRMVPVEGGAFSMGATPEQGNDAYNNEKPAHQVTLSSFAIGETEVTQALWQAVMGYNPSRFCTNHGYSENLKRPVEDVSWNDCQLFIAKLNEMTGKQFRMPTEAEWEYAARGGNQSQNRKYSGSNTIGDVAWYYDNSYSLGSSNPNYGTHAIPTKFPNELGIFNMSGNVSEWCLDWYDNYSGMPQTDPVGLSSGSCRVIRGGGWTDNAIACRVSHRNNNYSSSMSNSIGLRVAFDVKGGSKFQLSKTVLTVEASKSKSVDILNGNGNYMVEGGEDIVTYNVNGNRLTVMGIKTATSTIHVTDISTGLTTILTVIVKPAVETFTVNGVTFKMVSVDGGTFTMGATPEQVSYAFNQEKPAHQVTLSSFAIGQTEVTQELWLAVMGENPSYYTSKNGYGDNLQRPVEKVSWDNCQTFIAKLNEMTGRQFRMPTEAEWEFAARGGNLTHHFLFAGGNPIGDLAWYYGNCFELGGDHCPHTVATKLPNELGLYDMSGNVQEFCQDWYDSSYYSQSPSENPTGPSSGTYKTTRGGCFAYQPKYCRVAFRGGLIPSYQSDAEGLRLAL